MISKKLALEAQNNFFGRPDTFLIGTPGEWSNAQVVGCYYRGIDPLLLQSANKTLA